MTQTQGGTDRTQTGRDDVSRQDQDQNLGVDRQQNQQKQNRVDPDEAIRPGRQRDLDVERDDEAGSDDDFR